MQRKTQHTNHLACTSCGIEKPRSAFTINRRQCKECRAKYARRYGQANREKIAANNRLRNQSADRKLTIDGQTKSLGDWALLTNQDHLAIYARRNLSAVESVFGIGGTIPTLTVGFKTQTVGQWAAETGEAYDRIFARSYRGWDDTSAVFGKRKKRTAIIDAQRPVEYWATLTGQRTKLIERRLARGWSHTLAVWGRNAEIQKRVDSALTGGLVRTATNTERGLDVTQRVLTTSDPQKHGVLTSDIGQGLNPSDSVSKVCRAATTAKTPTQVSNHRHASGPQ